MLDFRKENNKFNPIFKKVSIGAWKMNRLARIDNLKDILTYINEKLETGIDSQWVEKMEKSYSNGRRELTEEKLLMELANRIHRKIYDYAGQLEYTYKFMIWNINIKVRRGMSKLVIIVDDCICYKMDINTRNNQTEMEYKIYEKLVNLGKQEVLDIIVPVLQYFPRYKVLVGVCCQKVCDMENACFETGYDYNIIDRIIDKYHLSCDLHDGNCGILYGKPVILDYGYNDVNAI